MYKHCRQTSLKGGYKCVANTPNGPRYYKRMYDRFDLTGATWYEVRYKADKCNSVFASVRHYDKSSEIICRKIKHITDEPVPCDPIDIIEIFGFISHIKDNDKK